jgi:hypothetical protein
MGAATVTSTCPEITPWETHATMTTGDIASRPGQPRSGSRVTDAIVEELTTWQARSLDPIYPVLLIDAIHLKVRDGSDGRLPRRPRPGDPCATADVRTALDLHQRRDGRYSGLFAHPRCSPRIRDR